MRLRRLALAALLLAVASCGGEPRPHRLATTFPRLHHSDVRVFEEYGHRQTSASRSHDVRLGSGIREVVFRLDCVGVEGKIDVEISGIGGGGMDCRTTGGGRGLVVQGIRPRDARAYRGHHDLMVLAPRGSRWSVAVDTSRLTQPSF